MLRRPRFKNHFHAEVPEPELVVLWFEEDCRVLRGPLPALLAPYLDGHSTFEQIVEKLEGRATALDVQFGLSMLERDGYVVEADETEAPGLAVFRDYLNVEPELFRRRLAETRVSVSAIGPMPTEPVSEALQSLGVQLGEDGHLQVVLSDNYLDPGLGDLNRQRLNLRRPWMLLKVTGVVPWIGPLFNPPRTGCWACLARRLNEHRLLQMPVARNGIEGNTFPLTKPALPSTSLVAVGLAATEILKWIVQAGSDAVEGKLITYDASSAALRKHVLVRQQNCPHCGDGRRDSGLDDEPLQLTTRRKSFTADGGHRAVLPQVVFRRLEHHVSPITGIVDSIGASYPSDFSGVHVFEAGLSPAIRRNLRACWGARFGGRAVGKGMTEAQARTSALCEALERYSGVFQGDEPRVKASYRSLGERAIHPNACLGFSSNQYQHRDQWNQRESDFNWIPQPFDEEREIEWTAVWSLTEESYKFVPTGYCYYAYPPREDHDFCRADSNGCAAGSTLEEAILQGFMELVERDSVALWWYNRLCRPVVDLETFDQPYFRMLLKHYHVLGREVVVLNLTADLQIPAFAALSRPYEARTGGLLLGFGAHFDPEVAVSRALTEMNQFLPYAVSGRTPMGFVNELPAGFPEILRDRSTRLTDLPRVWSEDLREDVMACVRLAAGRNLEVLVLDQTRPDVDLRVVKVIVPGMRHFWARFAPGRLYDVPAALGWLSAPLTEDQLNSCHLTL